MRLSAKYEKTTKTERSRFFTGGFFCIVHRGSLGNLCPLGQKWVQGGPARFYAPPYGGGGFYGKSVRPIMSGGFYGKRYALFGL